MAMACLNFCYHGNKVFVVYFKLELFSQMVAGKDV